MTIIKNTERHIPKMVYIFLFFITENLNYKCMAHIASCNSISIPIYTYDKLKIEIFPKKYRYIFRVQRNLRTMGKFSITTALKQ